MESKMPVRVLVIDDDPAMTELLALILRTKGFEVLVANSGADGVKSICNSAPEVVLLDLMMPEMDGWRVCQKVRECSNVPIIVLSALDSPGMVASALDAGADDYLIKPVPSGVLTAHLRKLTRRVAKNEKLNLPIHTAAIAR
jgi:two-component system KDP operon response regulator KdpE